MKPAVSETRRPSRSTRSRRRQVVGARVGFGDGYFIAFAGLMIVAAAVLAFVTGQDRMFGAFIAAAGWGSMLLAGFNAFGDWNAIAWTEARQTEPVEGSATPMLWALVFVSAWRPSGAVLWAAARGVDEAEK